jgi:phage terminase large subunit-like protein
MTTTLIMCAALNLAAMIPRGFEDGSPVLAYIPSGEGRRPSVTQQWALLSDKREMFYGGAGGGGKSDFLLMAALQYVDVPGYAALIVRREFTELSKAGGLIPRSHEWLAQTNAKWSAQQKQWSFPSGAVLEFGHMEHDNDRFKYGSTEYQFIGWDELAEFPNPEPYTFLFSRLRRRAGVEIPLRVRSASNPVGPGFAWVKERFVDPGDPATRPFLPALISDNPGIDQHEYRQSLAVLDPITRMAIEEGIWTARSPYTLFPRETVKILPAVWADRLISVRAWDLAASTEDSAALTAGVRMSKLDSTERPYVIENVVAGRWAPAERDAVIERVASQDGPGTIIVVEREPGSGGIAQVDSLKRRLAGYVVREINAARRGSKLFLAGPLSTQWGVGAVGLLAGEWNRSFLDRVEAFSSEVNIDEVDAASMAFLTIEPRGGGIPDIERALDGGKPRSELDRELKREREDDLRGELGDHNRVLDSGLREPD